MRVTVRSASMPPRSFSMAVYTTRPVGASTSLAQIRWRIREASPPSSMNLANDVWSNSPTPSRTARCSPAEYSNQFCLP